MTWRCRWGWRWRGSEAPVRSDLLDRDRRLRTQRRTIAFAGASTAVALLAAVETVNPGFLLGLLQGLSIPAVSPVAAPFAASAGVASGGTASGGATRTAGVSNANAASDDGKDATAHDDATPAAAPSSPLKTRPLSVWLDEVAREAGRDLVLSPDMRGDLTASESTKLDWKTRLEAYARVSGFEFSLSEGLIEARRGDGNVGSTSSGRISSTTVARAVGGDSDASAGTPMGAAGNGTATRTEPPPPPPETRVIRLVHAPAKETAAVLARAGDALDVTVSADSSSNSLVLSGLQPGLGRVLKALSELDRPRRRIHLEAKIIEVTRSARLDLGVEWKLTGTTVGGDVKFPPNVSEAGSAALVIATQGAAALDARISALEADGKLHVVSRPSVEMIEGSPATIESVRILRIRLPSNGTVVGDEVTPGPSSGRATEDIPVGVRLEVTPAIRGGTRVLLRIRAKSSNLGAPLPPDDIPEELSRMVDAEILVGNGETAVLGGLMRESGQDSGAGVPAIRKIPGLGSLFGKKSKIGSEEELLVLVTPRVLD